MHDWKSRLAQWIHAWEDLSELTQDCFPIRRPIQFAWKPALPKCPTLADFYALCDGGKFGSFDISSVTELNDPSSGWLADSPGLELKPGRWIQFGNHEFGHHLLWDADADEVVLYSPDDEEPTRTKQTISQFIERLLYPSKKTMEWEDDESNGMWIEALKEAEI
jgi:hypothetical protein